MGAMMNSSDVEFAGEIVRNVKQRGRQFTRDLVKDVYLDDLRNRGVAEAPAVSEKWINYYWQRLSSVPYNRLERAASSPQKLAKLLIELLGK
jgi:hypothetical protein